MSPLQRQGPQQRYATRDMIPTGADPYSQQQFGAMAADESPKLVIRKFIRSSQQDLQLQQPTRSRNGSPPDPAQARFLFNWLFGGRQPYYPPPPPPYGPAEYCVEYMNPHTGLYEEECTPI